MDELIPSFEFAAHETIFYVGENPQGFNKPLLFKTLLIYNEALKKSLQIVLRANFRVLFDPHKTRKTALFTVHRDATVLYKASTKTVGRIMIERHVDPHGMEYFSFNHMGEPFAFAEC